MYSKDGNEELKKIVSKMRQKVTRNFFQIKQSLEFGAYIAPQDYFVSYIFKTDKYLEKAKKSGLLEEITNYHKSLMRKEGVPIRGNKRLCICINSGELKV